SQTFVIEIKNNLSNPANYLAKRVFDLTFAAVFLLLLAVPMLILSVLIKISSPGPVILRQERIGRNGKRFICYKFRTMHVDAEEHLKFILEQDSDARQEWEAYWKLKNDPRITSVGRFLRSSSLDELPQIINVLKGDMSLVGPRPYLPREEKFLQEYGEVILSAPPGITGLWQTYGRSDKTYQERLSLDSWYVRNWNLWLDIVILIKTLTVVMKKEGGY
ncbi:MAG: sugar transferase, partial [bacterium]